MTTCPVCSFRNPDKNIRCFKCQALLKPDDQEFAKATKRARAESRWNGMVAVRGALETALRKSVLRPLWRLPEDLPYRFPFTAGWLTVVPGLGQVYNHQYGKAAFYAVSWLVLAYVCVLTFTCSYSNYLLFTLLGIWIFIWNDAVVTAIRINGQQWSLRNSVASFFALMFMIGGVLFLAQWLLPILVLGLTCLWGTILVSVWNSGGEGERPRFRTAAIFAATILSLLAVCMWRSDTQRIFTFVRLFRTLDETGLRDGDVLFVNNMAYWFRKPRVGEVIRFDPEKFTAQVGNDTYSINPQDYVQRICGGPGDTVEKQNGQWLRNGVPLPKDQEPFGGDQVPDGAKYVVPPDRYYAPVITVPVDLIASALAGARAPNIFQGAILKDYDKTIFVKTSAIMGRAVANVYPSDRRRWFPADVK